MTVAENKFIQALMPAIVISNSDNDLINNEQDYTEAPVSQHKYMGHF